MLERVWRKGSPLHTGGKVNLCNRYGEQPESSEKKLEIELPYDLAIPLLGMNLEKTIIRKDTCTPILTAALFTTAKTEQ